MTKTKQVLQPWQVWQSYPDPAEYRTGMKVSWNYYKTLAEAELCSLAAKHNAQIQLAAGYDFGYQSPGSIRPPRPGTNEFYADLYEVCLP
jgi:hypothetical protein